MRELTKHIEIECGLRLGVPFGPGCHRFAAEPSYTVSALRVCIPDAKKKATIGKPGGDEAASDSGLWTQHSGTPFHQRPHLRLVYS